MSSPYRRTYPEKGGLLLLDGGLNNKYSRAIISDNESPLCRNVEFTNGAVETRRGSSYVNTTAVGTLACDGLYTRHDSTGAETMVAWFGGTLWQLGISTFTTVASAQSVMTAGSRVGATEYENKLFFGNGGVSPYKYDGTYFTRHGVPPATGAVSGASAATSTGTLTGDYRWKVTYVNSALAEGDVGTSTVTLALVSGKGHLTGIPVAPASHGVSARRLYRTVTSGTTFLRVTEIADNTTTVYVDNTSDIALGGAAPTDNGEPPKYSFAVQHQDRVFCNDPSHPNYVFFSEAGEPYTFPSTNFVKAGDATSDLVKGAQAFGESLLIFCAKSVWLCYMPSSDPADWRTVRLRSPYGSKSPFALPGFDNKVMFPAMESDKFVGLAAISGDALAPSTEFLTVSTAGSDRQSDPIETDMFEVPEAHVGKISAVAFQNKLYFALPYGSTTTNNRVYVFDHSISNLSKRKRGAWVPFTGWNVAQWTIYGGNLYFGCSDTTGRVYKALVDSVYDDSGTAIDSYLWTKEFSGYRGDEDQHKDFRGINLNFEKSGEWFMDLVYRTDGDVGDGNKIQIDCNPGGSLWGTMRWGFDLWGGGQVDGLINQSLGQARGKRIQFKFSNQNRAGQKFKVTGFSFTYNRKGQR